MSYKASLTTIGAIIERANDPSRPILVQTRWKQEGNKTNGLLEIPAGHINPGEHPFHALHREVREECGLHISRIWPYNELLLSHPLYDSLAWTPFCIESCVSCTRIGLVFLCKGSGDLLSEGLFDAKDAHWISFSDLKISLFNSPEKWFPFHLSALHKYILARDNDSLWGSSIPLSS